MLGCQRTLLPWTIPQAKYLERLWPIASKSELLVAFPKRTWNALRTFALTNGFIRPVREFTCANELRNAIRQRCREDRISIGKFSIESGSGSLIRNLKTKNVDYNKVAAAVAFFGGKLVIDWQDE
jgi:hypothetical protein